MKIKVTWVGYQAQLKGNPILLVNEVDRHTTVAYDDKKHILVNNDNNT